MKLLKQLLCKHKYYAKDVSNHLVIQQECICCGKLRNIKKEELYGKPKLTLKFR